MIAFFVSAHGFGHASRASAVMAAIRQKEPARRLEVFSQIPAWFFEESVPGPIRCHKEMTDVGMVQQGPFEADLPATLYELEHFLPFSEDTITCLAKGLKERGCGAVVCDISPLGIAAAKKAGVPSILVENFTWDWIYEPYLDDYPSFGSFIEQFKNLFSSADIHIQTEPVCRSNQGTIQLKPFSRSPKTDAQMTRSKLKIPASTPLVLITMGGIATRHRFLDQLHKMPQMTFVVPHDVSAVSRHQNVIVLPHHSEFYHPDLVQAADLVIGKLGYSTLSEVGHAGKPFGYILREDSRESEVLAAYAARHIHGIAISEKSFPSCDWLENMPRLLDLKGDGPAFPNDVSPAADIILKAARKRESISLVSIQFDPFADRKSRDIRNRLSKDFVRALIDKDRSIIRQTVDSLLAPVTQGTYREYIQDRAARYDRVLHQADTEKIMTVRQQAVLLWNEHLFFECHELLEEEWQQVSGGERKALQGLIQAAGAYIHFARGKQLSAKKLAKKATCNMEAHKKYLVFIGNLEEMITALRDEKDVPPVLVVGV